MEVVASLSQGRTAAAQCGLFTHKSLPVIFEPPCTSLLARYYSAYQINKVEMGRACGMYSYWREKRWIQGNRPHGRCRRGWGMILKWSFNKMGAWTRLLWLKTGTGGGLL